MSLDRKEWDAMTPDQQFSYAYWQTWAVENYQHLMQEIPECPMHGYNCTSHASGWVKTAKKAVARLEHIDGVQVQLDQKELNWTPRE